MLDALVRSRADRNRCALQVCRCRDADVEHFKLGRILLTLQQQNKASWLELKLTASDVTGNRFQAISQFCTLPFGSGSKIDGRYIAHGFSLAPAPANCGRNLARFVQFRGRENRGTLFLPDQAAAGVTALSRVRSPLSHR
ncbi:hypothetical protein [Pseudoduganella buxea]|uniref:Uncharacterized protein n=1 Tax=Pseudoduganella buxea TaxID=1949069 RepID=A0A6I3T4J6_9BURK|nr:hypothetical protein [Pseudoduganella buxea]MTV56373.1 hypothetical protein [Pseudoduganella buxea]